MFCENDKIQIALEWAKSHYFTCSVNATPAFKAGLIKEDYLPGLYRLTSIPKKDRSNIIKAILHFGNTAVPFEWPNRKKYLQLLDSFAEILYDSEDLQHEFTLETAKGLVQALLRIESGDVENYNTCPLQSEMHSQFTLATELINHLDFANIPFDQIMAYSLFANFADHSSFSESDNVRNKLKNFHALKNWFTERWQSFQRLLQKHPRLMKIWNDFHIRWQNSRYITYVPDNAFEWAFDLYLINQKILSNRKLTEGDWEINIIPRRFAIGDDIDANIARETINSSLTTNYSSRALGKNLFILPASSIQGLNWMEVEKNLVETVRKQDLIVLKGYGNFLCSAPHGLQLERFHLFVPKGMAGRRITGKIEGWRHKDTCPPLILHMTGDYRIAAQYPKIENTISEILSGQSDLFSK